MKGIALKRLLRICSQVLHVISDIDGFVQQTAVQKFDRQRFNFS
jgi:hypothetical protein